MEIIPAYAFASSAIMKIYTITYSEQGLCIADISASTCLKEIGNNAFDGTKLT